VTEQLEEPMAAQLEEQQGIHHHHWIHHHLITEEPEEGECLDDRDKSKSYNSSNLLKFKNLKIFTENLEKTSIPGGC